MPRAFFLRLVMIRRFFLGFVVLCLGVLCVVLAVILFATF
jgi:hypothetical protein